MFDEPAEYAMLRSTATEVATQFGPEYWREKDAAGEFGEDFWDEMAEAGFQGLLIDESYGGVGMGMQEMSVVLETLAAEGTGLAGPWYLIAPVVMVASEIEKYGNERQKQKYLPGLASGDRLFAFAITEPQAGTNTLNIETTAERDGDEYVINGKKVWITFVDRADNLILVARTTSAKEVEKPTDGISLFLVDDLGDSNVDVNPIPKHGTNYSKRSCRI